MGSNGYGSFFIVLLCGMVLSGCAANAAVDIMRPPRSDRGAYRVEADIDRFMFQVNREIRLNRRQQRHIARLLRNRTYRLLDRARVSDHRYIYPYPRRAYREMNRTQQDFWRDVDRRIVRRLSRAQARRYATMTADRRYLRAAPEDRYGRRDNRRHEPRGNRRHDPRSSRR